MILSGTNNVPVPTARSSRILSVKPSSLVQDENKLSTKAAAKKEVVKQRSVLGDISNKIAIATSKAVKSEKPV